MITPDELAQCDVGVRDLVDALNKAGWTTIDSGDGISKPKTEGVLDFAHVAIRIDDPSRLVSQAERIYGWLHDAPRAGKWLQWVVEASYSPCDGTALLFLREAVRQER